MPDPNDPDPAKDDPKPDPTPDPDAGAKKALDAERKARRDAEKALSDVQAQLKELTDKDKSDADKLRDELTNITRERDDLAAKELRSEVAMAKGLTAAQAKRLVGVSREELEADADDILESFPVKPDSGAPPSPKPKPDLRGGGDPTEEPEETDPRKIADQIGRL